MPDKKFCCELSSQQLCFVQSSQRVSQAECDHFLMGFGFGVHHVTKTRIIFEKVFCCALSCRVSREGQHNLSHLHKSLVQQLWFEIMSLTSIWHFFKASINSLHSAVWRCLELLECILRPLSRLCMRSKGEHWLIYDSSTRNSLLSKISMQLMAVLLIIAGVPVLKQCPNFESLLFTLRVDYSWLW